jgi:hypothetical protein
VDVLIDDLDGSAGAETARLGWNGEWRELDLSTRNLTSLVRAVNKYWNVGHLVSGGGQAVRRPTAASSRSDKSSRDSKRIRAWASGQGIEVPARGRIPADIERQFNEANRRK